MEIPEYGRVYIAIKPRGGDSLSALTKNYIKKSLDDYRIASLDINLIDPTILYVEVDSLIHYNDKKTTKDSSGISTEVKNTLVSYGQSSSVSKFGGVIRYSHVLGAVDDSDIAITRNNTTLRMRRDMVVIDNTASYEVCFTNPSSPMVVYIPPVSNWKSMVSWILRLLAKMTVRESSTVSTWIPTTRR